MCEINICMLNVHLVDITEFLFRKWRMLCALFVDGEIEEMQFLKQEV